MGCEFSCFQRSTMSSSCTESSDTSTFSKAALERKLYIAKESPEPVFDLSNCHLKQVPSGIYSVCKVYRKDQLLLNSNKLKSLSSGGQLKDLYLITCLNISCNQLTELPSDIKYMVTLKELYIQNNLIKSIPEPIGCLTNLQILDVSNNNLSSLPASLGKLQILEVFKVNGNSKLKKLCADLGYAYNLKIIELDPNNLEFPPYEVASQGTERIMRFLCNHLNIDYKEPDAQLPKASDNSNITTIQNPFQNKLHILMQEEDANVVKESIIHEAAKLQKKKFLSDLVQHQSQLDIDIAKVHKAKDLDRSRLIDLIVKDEKEINFTIENMIRESNLRPDMVQQQLQHEQYEHDNLLEIVRQNYDNLKQSDVLKAMEQSIEENLEIEQKTVGYKNELDNLKNKLFLTDIQTSKKLEKVLITKDETRSNMIQQLLEDQNIQKSVVTSLIEQVDARAWSINQEISLITSHLARLSVIEQEKKRNQLAYNYNELLDQRVQLLNLLDDLYQQRNKRKLQLIDTINEMETSSDKSSDFWLRNYQKIVESAPKMLLEKGKRIDPLLAHFLLQEGVIHCLPFLVKFLFSSLPLKSVSERDLLRSGVSLAMDRKGILKAFLRYSEEKMLDSNLEGGTAPPESDLPHENVSGILYTDNLKDSIDSKSECVICMDSVCEIAFVPCGHLCCCRLCSEKELQNCPMCRSIIERKIKVITI